MSESGKNEAERRKVKKKVKKGPQGLVSFGALGRFFGAKIATSVPSISISVAFFSLFLSLYGRKGFNVIRTRTQKS